ncbi:hypothetical protein TIFTF001_013997 [Ficus carica]|uniref:Reverse transcriptase zinc-binding domain-containing protein n=1 Tax=Ficus carica TaxID=3494 RepID=A0AA88A5B4_FICCA|nr:hypothetical protein TIFTF001_013997 [Ficus carica]
MMDPLRSISIIDEENEVIGIADEVVEESERTKVLEKEPWTFNKALLVMKDKYFRSVDFLDVEPRGGISYEWRSILWGGIVKDKTCPRCEDGIESTSHALLECPVYRMVWRLSCLDSYVTEKAPQPFSDVLRILAAELIADDFALFCWMAWKLWNERNSLVHGKEGLAPEVLLEQSDLANGLMFITIHLLRRDRKELKPGNFLHKAVHEVEPSLDAEGVVLDDIREFLSTLHYPSVSHIKREEFAYFSTICFQEFGDRVKYWVTINEPNHLSDFAYLKGIYPPAHCSPPFGTCSAGDSDTEPLIAMHNMLISHAMAADIYSKHFQPKQGGFIGIVLNAFMYEPLRDEEVDRQAVDRALAFNIA